MGDKPTHVILGRVEVDGIKYRIRANLPGRKRTPLGFWITMVALVVLSTALALLVAAQ